jgi:urease beta subunit
MLRNSLCCVTDLEGRILDVPAGTAGRFTPQESPRLVACIR